MAKKPRYVAAYVAMLLDHDELQDAGLWLQRLDELAPGSPANLGFRVEMLVRRQQVDLAIELSCGRIGGRVRVGLRVRLRSGAGSNRAKSQEAESREQESCKLFPS